MPEAPGIPPAAKSPDLADTDALARPMPSLTTPTTPQLAEPSGPDEPTATAESGPPGSESEATPVVATSPSSHKEAEPPAPHESTPPAPSEPIPPAPAQAAPASPASHDAPSAVLTEVAAEVVLTEAQKRLCRIAETSDTDSENWQELRDLIAHEMHTILAAKIAALGPSSGPEGEKMREQVAAHERRLTALLVEFPDPPFTIQRICELTTVHSHQYRTPSKYLRALEKVILVTST
ncbi:protein phosphatase 4, regulatory subunit 2, partial [Tieghemiomyces parasiticus]